MLCIVTARNRHLYARELDEMFQLRWRVAVEHWGWRLPDAADGRDRDAFDTDKTIYFLSIDETTGAVAGCGRLNPTTGPHLLSDVFPACCDLQGVKRGETVFEFSRYMIDPALKRRDYRRAMGEIEYGINRYCLDAGVTHLTWLSYQAVYQHALSVWETRPLGAPAHFEDDGATYIAAISTMSEEGLARVARKYGFENAAPALVLRHDWAELADLIAKTEPARQRRRAA